MNLKDIITLQGIFELKVFKKGHLIEDYIDKNLIVNTAKEALAKLIAGAGAGKTITKIGFGTNGLGPTPDDTSLTSSFVKNISSYTFPSVNQVRFNWTLLDTEANGKQIREFGLICSDNTLFARKTRGLIEKADDISLAGTWTIIF
ncbi:MAG: hypothetical protein KatS3mg068_2572 [Candidatus Sericytochromatia bacterium]|nr:MAG: hypothetical protein KatS3mg068_1894 [Candidatus Sericytochromatia bacterium]GIW23501.1 MAG: hypothetical protein KatS3mg068_2508 [Candidatus Sericytochromatia bacterium]GIW23565.1 MAG: hypothetical protein KatS3mg068_2572 [Candidatus Sericytochromatia bacterium]